MTIELLRQWSDWSDGLGLERDDPDINGLYAPTNTSNPSLLGMKGELRPPPAPQSTSVTMAAGFHTIDMFEEAGATSTTWLYVLANDDTNTNGKIYKTKINTTGYGGASTPKDYTERLGHSAKYKGNRYWSTLIAAATMEKLTTVANGDIATDTITSGDASSGNGHLALIGHQLIKLQYGAGASVLVKDAAATTNANWGSAFPVGDSSEEPLGLIGLQGLTFAARQSGLYTFNERGRAGLLYNDFGAWRNESGPYYWPLAAWKGGFLYCHETGLYYYRLGEIPIPVGPEASAGNPYPETNSLDFRTGLPKTVITIGDWVYAIYLFPNAPSGKAYLMAGKAMQGNPADISWFILHVLSSATDFGLGISTRGEDPGVAVVGTTQLFFQDSTTLKYIGLSKNGSAIVEHASHAVAATSGVYLPEIYFPFGTNLSHVVVYTQNLDDDTTTPDQFQLIADINNDTAFDLGATIRQNGRSERPIKRNNVNRLRLGIECTTNTANYRAAPAVKHVELWGSMEKEID